MYQQQSALLLLFALNQIVQTVLQGIPASPCPKMFQYRFDGVEWFGMLSVRNPLNGQPLNLRVTLSLRGKPATNFLGNIEMLTRGQYLSDTPVLYKIKFPKTNIAPKLLQITINGQVVCLGVPEQSIFVTQIQLEHTRKYTFIPDDTLLPLTTGLTMQTPSASAYNRPDTFDAFQNPSDFFPTNPTFESKQLKISSPLTRFDSPMRATKDICGTIDSRIRFQVSQGKRRSSSSSSGRSPGRGDTKISSKSVVNKFRSTAGGSVPPQMTRSGILPESVYRNDGDADVDVDVDDINNSGASVPLVIGDFLDPLTDDVGSTTAAADTAATVVQELPSITRGAWPWLAAIYVNNLTSLAYQCGGTLISSRVVISSAHCFKMFQKSYTANEVLVFLGRHNLKNWSEEGSIAAPVDDVFIHPDFDSHLNSYDADIAVLVLKNPVRFNAFIRPACLWSGATDTALIEGEHGIVVGWGLSSRRSHSHSHSKPSTSSGSLKTQMAYSNVVPRAINTPIVSNDVCFEANDELHSLSSNRTFCAGVVVRATSSTGIQMPVSNSKLKKFQTKTKAKTIGKKHGQRQKERTLTSAGPCTGDSGAGLMIFKSNRWFLRGMVSASVPIDTNGKIDMGHANEMENENENGSSTASRSDSMEFGCSVNQYVIYTDVAKFLDWIFAFII